MCSKSMNFLSFDDGKPTTRTVTHARKYYNELEDVIFLWKI